MTQLSDGGNWVGKVSILNVFFALTRGMYKFAPTYFYFVVYLRHSTAYKILKKIEPLWVKEGRERWTVAQWRK